MSQTLEQNRGKKKRRTEKKMRITHTAHNWTAIHFESIHKLSNAKQMTRSKKEWNHHEHYMLIPFFFYPLPSSVFQFS